MPSLSATWHFSNNSFLSVVSVAGKQVNNVSVASLCNGWLAGSGFGSLWLNHYITMQHNYTRSPFSSHISLIRLFFLLHHRHPQFSIVLFNPLSAFLERNHVWSSATYHPLELASRTTCVVRSTCTGTMKKHAAAVSFIAPASTETAVVAGAAGVTNVDGAAAWAWAHVSVIAFY